MGCLIIKIQIIMQDINSELEMSDDDVLPPDEDEEDVGSVSSQGSRGRGRRRVVEAWTRVISLRRDDLNAKHIFPLGTDLLMSHNLPRKIDNAKDGGWQPHFLAKDFAQPNFHITMDAFKMEEQDLLDAGADITRHRRHFREQAEAAVVEQGVAANYSDKEVQEAVRKIQNRKATRPPRVAAKI